MAIMALDHNVMSLRSWPHGTALDGERSAVDVTEWNSRFAFCLRLATHACAPGFAFLLGVGVVYFGRSRARLGWGTGRMAGHFFVRAGVLTGITVGLGVLVSVGRVWFLNIVLFALAVDYLAAGWLWMVLGGVERRVALGLLKTGSTLREEDDPEEPLLGSRREEGDIAPDRAIMRAADVAWHVQNAVLLGLAVVAIWWNVWLSPTGGWCGVPPSWEPPATVWFRIWFYSVQTPRIISEFPPLAWLSFALLGLLYGRVVLARQWSARAINLGTAVAGLGFLLAFILTRVLRIGNLSEGCLHMPEHTQNPSANPYLASVPSFFYLVKYPPDVAFWSFTMAVNLIALALLGTVPARVATSVFRVLLVYGTSALFFYLAHIFLLQLLGAGWIAVMGHPVGFQDPFTGREAIGVDKIWTFVANWALALAILYPVCRWYGEFKRTKGPDSLWRFF